MTPHDSGRRTHASDRPPGRLHLDRRIDYSAIYFADLLQVSAVEIHI
ncbi:MAG TPA: hypothetical protein VNB87_14305 [Propionibacteriaceae bacterium]|nr:hypothetical protein [Propionibacteriaceae bacterium]